VHELEADAGLPGEEEALGGEEAGGEAAHDARGGRRGRRSSAQAGSSSLGLFAFDEEDWEATNDFGALAEASPGAEPPLDDGPPQDGSQDGSQDGAGGRRSRLRRSSAAAWQPSEAEAEYDLEVAGWQPREPSVGGSEGDDDSDLVHDDDDDEGAAPSGRAGPAARRSGERDRSRLAHRPSTYARGPQKLFAFLQRMLPQGDSEIDYVDDFLVCQLKKRKSRASAFGQLLTLASDDLLSIEQAEPYGTLTVRRGEAFDATVPEVPGAAATIEEEAEDEAQEDEAQEDEAQEDEAQEDEAQEDEAQEDEAQEDEAQGEGQEEGLQHAAGRSAEGLMEVDED
jgi:hypothetical protein